MLLVNEKNISLSLSFSNLWSVTGLYIKCDCECSRLNPLWGLCQEYKIEKNAVLQERLLSEKEALLLITTLIKGEVRRKMNFTYVLGFVVLRDVVKVFPVSSS